MNTHARTHAHTCVCMCVCGWVCALAELLELRHSGGDGEKFTATKLRRCLDRCCHGNGEKSEPRLNKCQGAAAAAATRASVSSALSHRCAACVSWERETFPENTFICLSLSLSPYLSLSLSLCNMYDVWPSV